MGSYCNFTSNKLVLDAKHLFCDFNVLSISSLDSQYLQKNRGISVYLNIVGVIICTVYHNDLNTEHFDNDNKGVGSTPALGCNP